MSTNSKTSPNRSKEIGQSLVELALTLPIVLLIFAGVFDFGRVLYSYIVVTNATREAAFAGAPAEASASSLAAVVVDEMARGGIEGGQPTISISYADKGFPPQKTIVVNVAYDVPLMLFVLPFSSVTVRAHSEMVTFWE